MPVLNEAMKKEKRTLVDSIFESAKTTPTQLAVGDSYGEYSWQQLANKIIDFSQQINDFGCRRILLPVKQNKASMALLAACQLSKIQVVLVPDIHPENWIKERCQEVSVDAIVSIKNNALHIDKLYVPGSDEINPQQNVMLFTSGTTGTPKCVIHNWNSIAAATSLRPKYAKKKWMCGYSLAQFAGLQVLCQAVINGGTLFIPKDFTPNSALNLMQNQLIECLSGTPSYIRQLLYSISEVSLSMCSLEQITLGGEVVDQILLDSLSHQFPSANIVHIYASSEAGAVISVGDCMAGFPAQLMAKGDLKIKHGELLIKRSHRAMLNYWGDSSQNKPWIHSGDLVKKSGDRIYFVGRKSSTINVGGFKVNPELVESAILTIPEVISVRVSGHKNPLLGEIPKATILANEDVDQQIISQKIRQYCQSQLAEHMIPRIIEFTTDLPLSHNQKIARRSNT